MIEFIAKGNADHMGFTWFYAIEDGNPLLENGVEVAYHSKDEEHARAIHLQTIEVRERIANR